jgi:hypothetical protein
MPERDMRGLEPALLSLFSLPPATSLSQTAETANALHPLNKTSSPVVTFLVKVKSPAIFI